MTLTIHGDPRSTFTRTARMGCVEKGVDYALDPLLPAQCKEQGLHPFGKIPAMTDGDVKLFETAAILVYVDAAFDGPSLVPAEARPRAEMVQWISAINDVIYNAMVRRYVLQYVFPKGDDGQPDRSVIDAALEQMREQLATLDAAYGQGRYLVDDRLSHADLFLAPILFYVGTMPEGPSLLAGAPAVQRGVAAIQARDSFASTMPPMPNET